MSKSRTLDEFRAAHDKDVIVPTKARAALAAMLKEGPENWEYEGQFVVRAGISIADWSKYRDQFDAHIVIAPGGKSSKAAKRVIFADAKVAKRVRGD